MANQREIELLESISRTLASILDKLNYITMSIGNPVDLERVESLLTEIRRELKK